MPLRLTSLRGEKHPAVVFASFASHLQKSSQKKKKKQNTSSSCSFCLFLTVSVISLFRFLERSQTG